ncbi:serine/threonine protein kinase [Saprolegnia parasitica CBS 223.65]|uniref:Serine/threonine protein kinase n=1 Tax=Saprolegnia parasitica (strain CBS 223.65) TaxID=695850 RepID=A0A067CCP0_SAPPC|nr:serine/threonine protein kinase [Saprolegnia parasitica CBS 223.65]KDO28228.1 serine/threonine protein kinase [Saprolegnia parasitica CBS 223.65]|eukprot:XP_012201053.1 serine/threonine protein kinase [Saprolegnia parasitica CBS 223.65]
MRRGSLHRVQSDSKLCGSKETSPPVSPHDPLSQARQWAPQRDLRQYETPKLPAKATFHHHPHPQQLGCVDKLPPPLHHGHGHMGRKIFQASMAIAKETHGWHLPFKCGVCALPGATCMVAGCGHYFHGSCIIRWIDTYDCCPVPHCEQKVETLLPAHKGLAKPRLRRSQSVVTPQVEHGLFDKAFHQRYWIDTKSLLGSGTYANVYRGHEVASGKAVAIKCVKKSGLKSEAENLGALEEIAIMHGLAHANIVNLHAAFSTPTHYVLALDWVRGGTLHDLMHGHIGPICGPAHALTEATLAPVLKDIVSALHYLHTSAHIVHGDLKPLNVLVESTKTGMVAKLCDFGNAVRLEEGLRFPRAARHELAGSFGYMAPELLCRSRPAPASDMWAVGIMAYEALVAFPPFYPYGSCVNEDATFPERYFRHVSPVCVDFVQKLLARNPDQRLTAKAALAHPFLQTPP